jgi:hypothetical protein
MADTPSASSPRNESFAHRELQARINRAETIAMAFWGFGVLLFIIGLVVAVMGGSPLCLLLGGFLLLAGGIENNRAEILKLHAKIESE